MNDYENEYENELMQLFFLFLSKQKTMLTGFKVLKGLFFRLNYIHHITTVAIFSLDWQVDQ